MRDNPQIPQQPQDNIIITTRFTQNQNRSTYVITLEARSVKDDV